MSTINSVDSIQDLRGLTSLQVGDSIHVKRYHQSSITNVFSESTSNLGGGIFNVIKTGDFGYDLDFNSTSALGGLFQSGLNIDMSLSGKGSIMMRFKLEDGALVGSTTDMNGNIVPPPTTWIATFTDNNSGETKFELRDNEDGTYSVLDGNNKGTTPIVKDDSGEVIDNSMLHYGEFYTVLREPDDKTNPINKVRIARAFNDDVVKITLSDLIIGNEEWRMDDAPGATSIESLTTPNPVSIGINGTAIWGGKSNYDNGFTLIQCDDDQSLLQRIVKDNLVTPYDAGAIDTGDVTDYTQDSWGAFQKVFDSIYEVYVPVGKYYISKELKIRIPKKITMSGMYSETGFIGENSIEKKDSVSVIYSNENIDYIRIQSSKVIFTGGLLYTHNSVKHTKRGFVLDGNYKIWDTKLLNVAVFGNEETLLLDHEDDFDPATDIKGSTDYFGTIAYELETDDSHQYGYFEQIYIEGIARNCNVGVRNIDFPSETKDLYKSWQNNHQFHVRGTSCKTFYDVTVGSVTISGLQQGGAVRNEKEKERYGVIVDTQTAMIDVSIIDPDTSTDEADDGTYRYDNFQYYIIPGRATILGPSMRPKFFNTSFNTDNFMPGSYELVHNPKSFYVNSWTSMISGLNNSIAFIGDDGKVSYQGFTAPSANWFEDNLLSADDTSNVTALNPDSNVDISNPDVLLTSKLGANTLAAHTIGVNADDELSFAEIYISDLQNFRNFGNSKIRDLFLTTDNSVHRKLQFIIKFEGTSTPWSKIIPVKEQTDFYPYSWWINNTNQDFGAHANDNVESIIIRFIGSYELGEKVRINDIALKQQYQREIPVVRTSGDQKIYGDKHFVMSSFGVSYPDTTPVEEKDISGTKMIKLDQSGTYTLPKISTLNRDDIFIRLKNVTNASVTVQTATNTSDTIEGATSVTIASNEVYELFISSNNTYEKSN